VKAHNRTIRQLVTILLMTAVRLPAQAGHLPLQPADVHASTDFSNATPSSERLHVMVGRSLVINTKRRLTRVYITNPTVLDSYTASPFEVLCTAKQPGLSSLVVWDENGGSQTYLISSDIDVDGLRASLRMMMPHEPIEARGEEGRIVLTGTVSTEAVAESAVKLAALYGPNVSNALAINAAAIKQVRLKVRIVEVDRSKIEQFGFNLFYAGNKVFGTSSTTPYNPALNTTTSSTTGASTYSANTNVLGNAANFLFYLTQYNVGASIQDLESRQVLQILAEPTIMTLSGQKADFLAGGEFPFPVVQGSTGGLTSVTIQFRSYGVKLDFTPLVNPDGTITLKVAPEVSALDFTNAVQISGYTIPALSTRRAETQVVLKSGQSFAISGLLDKRTTDSYAKTPGIASIPILGELFKSKNINHSNSELVVIVTPTTVDPLTEADAITEPKMAVKTLDVPSFDKNLPKSATVSSTTTPAAQPGR
jgi:pilus assembly protein CpaC